MIEIKIEVADPRHAPARCEPILRSLPDWFGIEESTRAYIAATAQRPTWIASIEGRDAGFITIQRHFDEAADIHCMGVHIERHGQGVGTALVRAVEEHLRGVGVRFLQVKTQGPSRPSALYARTLQFYLRSGFARLEEVHGLWSGIPCLILVKGL